MGLEITLIKHQQMFSWLYQTWLYLSSHFLTILLFCFIHFNSRYLVWTNLPHVTDSTPFDRYPFDSSENNGGSSSSEGFSSPVHNSRSHTLQNIGRHTSTFMPLSLPIELSVIWLRAVPLWPAHLQSDCILPRLAVCTKNFNNSPTLHWAHLSIY